MSSFKLSRKAKDDLRGIARFTEHHWGIVQRNAYIKKFDDAFHELAESPLSGVGCEDIKLGYRKIPHGAHVIFYKISENNCVEIIRILHQSMDIRPKLLGI
ncbi:type II toxin-antitoxin system RelE/ParE family toxin [Microbulbifer sp. HZ11]|uniref:type II toxin-antitoxin system RelE/ParE family toxin n=1 Tax=unclassified Microbulbifer TaxID=2619833 RepID=UPI0009DCB890|nr:type II toxin-antitoxin system RelE/ParE family toxin [Microbulbifer sp. HZ11]